MTSIIDPKVRTEIIVFKIINGEILFLLLKGNKKKDAYWQHIILKGTFRNKNTFQTIKRILREKVAITKFGRIIDNPHAFGFDVNEFGIEVTPDTNVTPSSEYVEMKWCSLNESLTLLKDEDDKNAYKRLFSLLTEKKTVSKKELAVKIAYNWKTLLIGLLIFIMAYIFISITSTPGTASPITIIFLAIASYIIALIAMALYESKKNKSRSY